MDSFCGSELWNINVTWNTDDPDFTPCFEKTVLAWIPCLFLWIFSPLEVFYMLTSKQRNIPWSFLNICKFILSLLIIVDCLAEFVYATVRSPNDKNVYPVDIYSPAVKFLTFCLLVLLQWYNKKRGIQASGLVFLFWLLCLVCGVPRLRTIMQQAIQDQALPDPPLFFITYMVFYCAVVLSFLLTFFVDPPPLFSDYPKVERLCPEKSSSFPSRLTFNWFSPIAWLGYRTPLQAQNLWSMNHEDTSCEVVPRFDKYWNALVTKQLRTSDAKTAFIKSADNFDMKTKFTSAPKTKSSPVSILTPMFKAFGATFFFGAVFYLMNTLLTFVSPQLLKLLIAFVSSDESLWKGYAYAALLFVTAVAQTLLMSQYYYRMSLVGLRIRTALVSSIYRKALRVSNQARKESTVGEVVNLMAVDAQRFMDLTTYVNLIWGAPLQIVLSLYFLWQTLGPSVLAGLAVMVVLVPINGFVANKVKTLQISQMKNKDERVKLMNEIISGMKILKLYAWEASFEQQVLAIREREMIVLKKAAYLNACTSFIWTCAPFLVSLSTFATYVLVDSSHVLDSEKAFVSLSLFNILRAPLALLPMMITFLIQAGVSVKRINKFLNSEELDPTCVQHDQSEEDPIVVENGTFSWGVTEEDATVLQSINLRVKQGSLVAVVGTVGSGKSSLLAGILGEMEKLTGRVNTKGTIAYVPQQAWIQNATLKDNILFGQDHEPSNYSKIVRACALQPDLDMLPAGDMTEIGEKGINLSGGQKQRVSLARAVYSNSDVYLLDDPLSAVDSHVGKHIFESVVGPNGLLKNKTRILVTHAITYLPEVDLIVVLKDGRISESGTYKQLLAQKGAFADFLEQYLQEIGDEEDIEVPDEVSQLIESKIELKEKFIRQKSQVSDGTRHSLRKRRSSSSSSVLSSKQVVTTIVGKPGDKLIEAEKAETGSVKGRVYMDYIRSIGTLLAVMTILLNVVYQLSSIGSNIWLSVWSSDTTTVVNGAQDMAKTDMYLGVYGAFGLGQVVTRFICSITLYLGCIYASRSLHIMLLRNVLRSPATFFDITPIGRILNRFGKDVDILDETLPVNISTMLVMFFSVMATLVVISYTTPIFIVVIIPIAAVYFFVQRFYIATSRQLKRLESVSRSPIYSHFSESVTGVASIRAYGVQDRFISESEKRVDFNQVCLFPNQVANRWLAVRLETVGNLIILFAALFAVIERGTTSAGLVGLSVSYALQITQVLNFLVRMTSDVETNIVAVERIKEYGETPQEAAWEISPGPPPSWPDKGQVEFRNFQVRYREGLDLVLKGVSFTVNGGEKVGIVGRTGAGKSSLTLCLFRIIEPAGGQITIDGLDISKLGLHDLRSRITIIPQDPVLFSGTLRMNLDPFNKESDDAVWKALELAHLKHFVKGLNSGLHHLITEGGDNLSVGQRQLVCLGRALLRKTKVLVLDEATAAVDLETDDLIQQTIRSQFSDCTVLTIAHRLNTIMDYDRVIVLDQGLMVEYDSPANFLKDKSSVFYGMAKDANIV